MTTRINLEGLDNVLEYFERVPDVAKQAARLAINDTITRRGMRLLQDEMYDQVAFPRGYLAGDRLRVTKYAKESDLEGIITGRKRATSLARFAGNAPIGSQTGAGVRVTVRRGRSVSMRNAWLVRLRKGASLTEDQYNVGLAVRLRDGESLNKYSTHKSWLVPGRVALLYGPSVDQVFRDVADDSGPQILDLVATQFFRHFERLA